MWNQRPQRFQALADAVAAALLRCATVGLTIILPRYHAEELDKPGTKSHRWKGGGDGSRRAELTTADSASFTEHRAARRTREVFRGMFPCSAAWISR